MSEFPVTISGIYIKNGDKVPEMEPFIILKKKENRMGKLINGKMVLGLNGTTKIEDYKKLIKMVF